MFLQLKINPELRWTAVRSGTTPEEAAPQHENNITLPSFWTFPHITVFKSHWYTYIYIFIKTKKKEKGRTNKQKEKNQKPAVTITKHLRWLQWTILPELCRLFSRIYWVALGDHQAFRECGCSAACSGVYSGVFCPCRRLMLRLFQSQECCVMRFTCTDADRRAVSRLSRYYTFNLNTSEPSRTVFPSFSTSTLGRKNTSKFQVVLKC